MWLRDLSIKNFRKIESLNISLQKGLTILVGENNSGKTAIIDALRLMLFSSRDFDSLRLSEDDFRHGSNFKPIEISGRFTGLNEIDEVHFSECLVDIGSGVFEIQINLRIEFNKVSNRPNIKMWGGETEGGRLPSNHYDRLESVYLQPLRDPEKGLRPSQYSQIAKLLSSITPDENQSDYEEIVNRANEQLRGIDYVENAVGSINSKFVEITGSELSQETDLIFNDPNFRRIIADLKPEINNLPFSINGLGYNNLMYAAATLATLSSGDHFSHKSILIEEPEAHLHPQLQVLLLRYLARVTKEDEIDVQVIASTHSPILASQAPIDSIVSISELDQKVASTSISTLNIENKTKKKLQRYLDATRGELFFARRILMVEGISEALLIPILTHLAGGDLKESAITIVNTQGINFDAFLALYQENAKNIPVSILTDGDANDIGGEKSDAAKKIKKKEGETLARVRNRTLELLESMDANTYSGLEKSFLGWLQEMVKGRFVGIQMNGDLPSTFTTDDGRPLTYSLLSHGTKDTVALAWRFALTEHFLQDQPGFIILDDPMVDMDPGRRELASKAIEEFAKEQQVLVMTCHPEYAEMLNHQSHIEIQS